MCSSGFQVVGGENSGRMDLGTIISSISPGGPADVNGCLKPGRPVFCFTVSPELVTSCIFYNLILNTFPRVMLMQVIG